MSRFEPATFAELHPNLAGFEEHWELLLPRLERLQAEVRSRYIPSLFLAPFAAAAGAMAPLVALVWMFGFVSTDGDDILGSASILVALPTSVALPFMLYPAIRNWGRRARDEAADLLRASVFDFFGLYHRRLTSGFLSEPFSRLGLIGAHTSTTGQDYLSGEINGVEVEFCEVATFLKRRSASDSKTIKIFKGWLVRLRRGNMTDGRILIRGPKKGLSASYTLCCPDRVGFRWTRPISIKRSRFERIFQKRLSLRFCRLRPVETFFP